MTEIMTMEWGCDSGGGDDDDDGCVAADGGLNSNAARTIERMFTSRL